MWDSSLNINFSTDSVVITYNVAGYCVYERIILQKIWQNSLGVGQFYHPIYL